MAERKSAAEMFGEFMREAGVLFLVFGLLDRVFELRKSPSDTGDLFWWVTGVALLSFLIWGIGVAIEIVRKP